MIGIKKVQVVPLDENYAKIIDSFNTTDDKTKNAPSINAVEGKLSEINSDISDINGDISDINNTLTSLTETDTSSTFTFTDTGYGSIDIKFKRVGNVVKVEVSPILYANRKDINIDYMEISLPDWAKISDTPSRGNNAFCSIFGTEMAVQMSSSTAGYVAPQDILQFVLYKDVFGDYYVKFIYARSTTTSSNEYLRSWSAYYLVD